MDNLMTYKLAKEWATKTKQEALLLKVAFMKVYDQLDHKFIWAVMKALGFRKS